MARIPPMSREAFPEDLRYAWDRVTAGRTPPNIFAALGNNPNVLLGYLRLGNALWNHCGLDVRTRELVILRCAYLRNSAYEWHQHVRIGRDAGLDNVTINALRNWRESERFSEAEKALFAWADAMAASDHPGDPAFAELQKHFDASAIVGITILIAYYFATAKFLAAMEVQTEETFVGWSLPV
jgi:4-carboxymuconolactone decarboxylase